MTHDVDILKVGNWPLISCGQAVGWVTWITERLADALGTDVSRLPAAVAEAFPDDTHGGYLAKVARGGADALVWIDRLSDGSFVADLPI